MVDTVLVAMAATEGDERSLESLVSDVMSVEQGRLFLSLPGAMVAGVLAYFDLRREPSPWLAAFLIATGIVLVAVLWRRPVARGGVALLLFAAFGFGGRNGRRCSCRPLSRCRIVP